MVRSMNRFAAAEEELAGRRPELLAYAFRLSGDRDEAEDIVHTALVKALEALRRGDVVEHPRAWLYRIVHNEAETARRRDRRARAALTRFVPVAPDSEDRAALYARIEREIAQLPDPYRAALRLRYLQHLKNDEAADVLGVPVGTLKAQVSRGLRILTERLGEALGGEAP